MKPQHTGIPTEQCIPTFWRNLDLLAKFLEVNKHFPEKKENKTLFHWMNNMRRKYKRGCLPGPFISELNALGFKWSMKEEKWYQLARAASEHLKQGKMPTIGANPVLYGWLRNSLDQYRNKLLTDDKKKIIEEMQARINQLKREAPYSSLIEERVRELKWEEQFNQLVQFRKIHTKCWPRPASGDQAERELYKWCSLMRCIFRQHALSDAWVHKLKEIGFNL
jgi:hypothetical protein